MERENNFSPDIKLSDSVPTISFASHGGGELTTERFDIDGNVFDAWYDDAHRLVFIIDYTADRRTPNVLLIMDRDERDAGRKWDDILYNDYGVDLETIRPKKNNKYQKLDIEYDGLSVFNGVIAADAAGADMAEALAELSEFRDTAARSLAAARMAAANEQMRRAAETIAETEISINNGHSSIKQLKEKLSNLKSKVGREPTKESAAKILRAQAKMEQVTEKLKRAELRLRRARRRLADAENDAGLARAQIAAGPLYENEPKVNDMSEEVKPLFTKDPEIMDERIAFKPIEFGPSAAPAPQQPEFVAPPLNLTPTSPFAQASGDRPRTPAESFEGRAEYQPAQPAYAPAPVAPTFAKAPAGEPERSAGAPPMSPPPPMSPTRADFMANRPEPMTDEPIKITSGAGRSGPSAMYYVMLVLLIILSVLTLWLYQNRMTAGIPDILQPVASEQQTAGTQKSGLRATFGKMFEKSAPAQPAIPEPVVRPAPELADVDSAFLDEDGFMRPVTLPAQIPGDMPPVAIRCLAECSPQCDSMHEGCPGYDAWVNGTYEEWQEQQSAEYNEPVFGPAIEPEYTEAAEVFEEYEEPAAIMCEDGSAPYEDGCCGDEILTDLAGFGPACCPGGVEDKKDCKVPVR